MSTHRSHSLDHYGVLAHRFFYMYIYAVCAHPVSDRIFAACPQQFCFSDSPLPLLALLTVLLPLPLLLLPLLSTTPPPTTARTARWYQHLSIYGGIYLHWYQDLSTVSICLVSGRCHRAFGCVHVSQHEIDAAMPALQYYLHSYPCRSHSLRALGNSYNSPIDPR